MWQTFQGGVTLNQGSNLAQKRVASLGVHTHVTSSNCCSTYVYRVYTRIYIFIIVLVYIFSFSLKSSTDFNRRASTNCNLQWFYCCFSCLQCTRRFDLQYCYTVIQRTHCATMSMWGLELLCTERVQRPMANDLTARTEAATLFLLLLPRL